MYSFFQTLYFMFCFRFDFLVQVGIRIRINYEILLEFCLMPSIWHLKVSLLDLLLCQGDIPGPVRLHLTKTIMFDAH